MNEVASKYGLALFSLALERDKVNPYQIEAKKWLLVLQDNEEFIKVLNSAFLSLEERKDILTKTLIDMSEDFLIFFRVVLENNNIDKICDILKSYISYANEYNHVSEGLIYSAIPLNNEKVEEIAKKFSQKLHKEVYLNNVIDKSLIGGVKIVMDGHIYDDSLKHHIEEMKVRLTSNKEDVNDENKDE